jgi:hypothetical protein
VDVGAGSPRVSGSYAIPGYLAMSRLPGLPRSLEERTILLAAQLAAELSGCQWCIERCRHDCRTAGISEQRLLTKRERAALDFVGAVAQCPMEPRHPDEQLLQRVREVFTEAELAELTAIVAEHHCLELLNSNYRGS